MLSDERLIWIMDGRRPCPAKTEVYSRVVGFFRPVQQWNRGKKEEFRQRRVYRVSVTSGPACSSFLKEHERGHADLSGNADKRLEDREAL